MARGATQPELPVRDDLLRLEDGHCSARPGAEAARLNVDPRRLRYHGATSLTTIVRLVAKGQG